MDRTFVGNLSLTGLSFQPLIMLMPGLVVTSTAFDHQFCLQGTGGWLK